MATPLEHHPGYVTRYDMQTGKPYYVPVGTPRNKEDKAAQEKYDNDAYVVPMQQFYEAGNDGSGKVFDPDTGKPMKLGELQDVLMQRYPQQVSNDWDKGANMPQPVVPGQGARVAQHIPYEGALPKPQPPSVSAKPQRQFILPQR